MKVRMEIEIEHPKRRHYKRREDSLSGLVLHRIDSEELPVGKVLRMEGDLSLAKMMLRDAYDPWHDLTHDERVHYARQLWGILGTDRQTRHSWNETRKFTATECWRNFGRCSGCPCYGIGTGELCRIGHAIAHPVGNWFDTVRPENRDRVNPKHPRWVKTGRRWESKAEHDLSKLVAALAERYPDGVYPPEVAALLADMARRAQRCQGSRAESGRVDRREDRRRTE